MKLCVFPNDPLKSYYIKGEIKDRYFNPKNFFDEVHVISFIENEIRTPKITSKTNFIPLEKLTTTTIKKF